MVGGEIRRKRKNSGHNILPAMPKGSASSLLGPKAADRDPFSIVQIIILFSLLKQNVKLGVNIT